MFKKLLISASALQCFSCDSNREKECHDIKSVSPVKAVECRPNVVKQSTPEWLAEIISISNFGTELEITVPMVCQKITAING
ncbi:unnamed protein product [Chironomus riparius]|uniref:Uncharacterized protein n=1 Tax=Chironomus riparius TaxID=315576 RepID=A0A9N9S726_9DIPT|nr:unnamed protein product [Chironomus riparius]